MRSEVFIWEKGYFHIKLDQRFTQNACLNKIFFIMSNKYSNFLTLVSYDSDTYTLFTSNVTQTKKTTTMKSHIKIKTLNFRL